MAESQQNKSHRSSHRNSGIAAAQELAAALDGPTDNDEDLDLEQGPLHGGDNDYSPSAVGADHSHRRHSHFLILALMGLVAAPICLLYLYLALLVSGALYGGGLGVALGLALAWPPLVRRWWVRRALLEYYHWDEENHDDNETKGQSTRNQILELQGTVMQQQQQQQQQQHTSSSWWWPWSYSLVNQTNNSDGIEPDDDDEAEQLPITTAMRRRQWLVGKINNKNNNKTTTAVTVQYQVPLPAGFVRSDGYIVPHDNLVDVVMVKQFRLQRHVLRPDNHKTITLVCPRHNPRAAYPKMSLLELATTGNVNHNTRLNSTLTGLALILVNSVMMIVKLEHQNQNHHIAMALNAILWGVVSAVAILGTWRRDYEAIVMEDEACGDKCRIVSWVPHGERQSSSTMTTTTTTPASTTARFYRNSNFNNDKDQFPMDEEDDYDDEEADHHDDEDDEEDGGRRRLLGGPPRRFLMMNDLNNNKGGRMMIRWTQSPIPRR